MLEKYAAQFVGAFASLHRLAEQIENMRPQREPTHADLAEMWRPAKASIAPVLELADAFPLRFFSNGVKRIDLLFESGLPTATLQLFRELLNALPLRLQEDLDDLHFLYVSIQDADVYNNAASRWNGVIAAYPSAEPNIKEAARCLALGCYTASAFHAMRVIELGLHALARELQIPIASTASLYEQGKVLAQIDAMLKTLRQQARTQQRQDDLQFYGEIATRIAYFKDGFRNPISHSDVLLEYPETSAIFEHTRAFMLKLSTRVSE